MGCVLFSMRKWHENVNWKSLATVFDYPKKLDNVCEIINSIYSPTPRVCVITKFTYFFFN